MCCACPTNAFERHENEIYLWIKCFERPMCFCRLRWCCLHILCNRLARPLVVERFFKGGYYDPLSSTGRFVTALARSSIAIARFMTVLAQPSTIVALSSIATTCFMTTFVRSLTRNTRYFITTARSLTTFYFFRAIWSWRGSHPTFLVFLL